MKNIHNLLNQKNAQKISAFMKIICDIIIALLFVMLVLGLVGRLEYDLRFATENYPRAIYATENEDFSSNFLTVSMKDSLYVTAQAENGKIQLLSYLALVFVYAINIIPTMFAYYFLSKVFNNVANGEIFIEKNANYIFYYALIQSAVAVILPFIKLIIIEIVNMIVVDNISISTGSDMLNQFIPSVGFFVAAYIIKYGVSLQDEVDQTI